MYSLHHLQGVVAGLRVYHQRRHSGFPGDTWPDQPCVPALRIASGQAENRHVDVITYFIPVRTALSDKPHETYFLLLR